MSESLLNYYTTMYPTSPIISNIMLKTLESSNSFTFTSASVDVSGTIISNKNKLLKTNDSIEILMSMRSLIFQ